MADDLDKAFEDFRDEVHHITVIIAVQGVNPACEDPHEVLAEVWPDAPEVGGPMMAPAYPDDGRDHSIVAAEWVTDE